MSHVVLLVGLPGTGKLTVATELVQLMADRGKPVRLIDNHYVNDVIFALIDPDGERPLGPAVWERVGQVREAVFSTIEEESPGEWSFVLTASVGFGDEWFVDRVADLAERRGSSYTVVELSCNVDELERRVAAPGRSERFKMTSGPGIREIHDHGTPMFDRPNVIHIDTTNLAPHAVAVDLLGHIEEL